MNSIHTSIFQNIQSLT